MNYRKLYFRIIENRKCNPLPENIYGETHHIIPRSIGGSNDPDNLVRLTPREHFICHYLLTKMYPEGSYEWHKMNHAFLMMKAASSNQKRYFNSRLYEASKTRFSIVMSKEQKGKRNSQYGKCWIYNEELKVSKKINKAELEDWIKKGWKKGRVIGWDNYKNKKKIKSLKYKIY